MDRDIPSWNTQYQKFEQYLPDTEFEPKVVGKLPKASNSRGVKNKYIVDKAIELAKDNPNQWILAYETKINDSKLRRQKANTLRTSTAHFVKTRGGNGWQAKMMTVDENTLAIFIIKEER